MFFFSVGNRLAHRCFLFSVFLWFLCKVRCSERGFIILRIIPVIKVV
jgi:hypothetical protein